MRSFQKPPKVSICVPNLNTRRYLPERFESIFNQTFQDWELVVVDNYSDDGAWEYIQELVMKEPRMRVSQAPREGLYANWNNCIRLARGEYVYLATSDDTMTADCLEKMVGVLDKLPKCDLAHCCATFIDQNSNPIDWKWETWPHVRYFGDMIKALHIRPTGHDAVLAFALHTPYFSITQVLIRRNLFERIGFFDNCWGSSGDLEWQMRATLLTSTVHIPEHLATWRVHPQQATQSDRYLKAKREGMYVRLADAVIDFSRRQNVPQAGGLPRSLRRFPLFDQLKDAWPCLPGRSYKARFALNFLFYHLVLDPAGTFWAIRRFISANRGNSSDNIETAVRKELVALKIGNPVLLS